MNRDTKGRFTRKPTAIEADVGMDDERYAAFESLLEDLGMKYPMAGFIVHLAVSAAGLVVGYHVAAALALGTLLFTGSLLFSFLIGMLAFVWGCVEAIRTGALAARYVASGRFEDDYQRAKGWALDKVRNVGAFGKKFVMAERGATVH